MRAARQQLGSAVARRRRSRRYGTTVEIQRQPRPSFVLDCADQRGVPAFRPFGEVVVGCKSDAFQVSETERTTNRDSIALYGRRFWRRLRAGTSAAARCQAECGRGQGSPICPSSGRRGSPGCTSCSAPSPPASSADRLPGLDCAQCPRRCHLRNPTIRSGVQPRAVAPSRVHSHGTTDSLSGGRATSWSSPGQPTKSFQSPCRMEGAQPWHPFEVGVPQPRPQSLVLTPYMLPAESGRWTTSGRGDGAPLISAGHRLCESEQARPPRVRRGVCQVQTPEGSALELRPAACTPGGIGPVAATSMLSCAMPTATVR